jgi:tol-pal system protein YbgF
VRLAAVFLPVVAVAATGCLATKGDIRLLQDELRATRAQVGMVDTSVIRNSTQLQRQIMTLSAELLRLSDSVRVQGARLAALQATTNGELNTMNGQIVQMQALLGQTTRNVQEAQQQIRSLREQPQTVPTAPVTTSAPPPGDTSTHRVPAGLPGSATLFLTGKEQLQNGAYSTGRMALDQLLSAYPNAVEAPAAQFYVGQSYTSEGNPAAADSVYQLVYTRYPKSPDAPTALYRHGTYLWDANKKQEARGILNRVLNEYPTSDAAPLVKSFLRDRDR